MIRLWVTILQKTKCLCLGGRAGARVQPGRVPESSFEESYKKEGGASSGCLHCPLQPTLSLSGRCRGGNWGWKVQWPIRGLMATQEQTWDKGRQTQPVPSSVSFCQGVGRISRRRQWHPTPVFLPGESQGWGSLLGCRLWGHTESDMTEVT